MAQAGIPAAPPASFTGYSAADVYRWAALALVFGAAMINYIDRQAIALLKPTLEAEFGWSDIDYAHIVSGFQLATIAAMLFVGWFVDRVGVRIGYAVGVAGWSLAQAAHVLATTVSGFFLVRVALGATEAVNLPAAVKTVSTWFRGDDRSLALGVMNLAPNIGAVATPLIVPAIALAYGWKAAFLATAAFGAVWLVFWFALPKPPAQPAARPDAPTVAGSRQPNWRLSTLKPLLADRRTWAIALGKCLSDFVWVFLLFWAPDLFARTYGLSQAELAGPVALVFLMAGAGSLFAGWLSSRLLAAGRSFNFARKLPMALAALLATPVFIVSWAPDVWVGAALLGLTLAAHQMFSTSMFGLATDVFPTRQVGVAIGFGATIGGLSGLAMNEFTGWTLETTNAYWPMLTLCAVAKIFALLVVHALTPDIDAARARMLAAEAA
jgi:ACS family hexuronate transporter-like MFS transporter